MNPVLIHYFSATGNTARAVRIFRESLEAQGRSTRILLITGEKSRPSEQVEEVLAFPTLAFSAPSMVKDYVRRLPRVQGRSMAVLCVNAGGPAQAIREMEPPCQAARLRGKAHGVDCLPLQLVPVR